MPGRLTAALLPWARPFLMPVLRGIEGANLSLAPIVEDLPYAEHRVLPVAGDVTRFELHYTVKPEARQRVRLARERMREILRGRPAGGSWRKPTTTSALRTPAAPAVLATIRTPACSTATTVYTTWNTFCF